jgi:hypothetical protein
MKCRRCEREFEPTSKQVCPYCGAVNPVARSGVLRTSTILIAAGKSSGVYRSVAEVPEPLKKKLLKSTNGLNSATILIADRRGREELSRAIRKLPTPMQRRLLQAVLGRGAGATANLLSPAWQKGLAWVLAVMSLALIWLAFVR